MRKLLISSVATAALVFAAPVAFAQSPEGQQTQTEQRKTPEHVAPGHAAPQRGSQLDRRDQSEEGAGKSKRDSSDAAQQEPGGRRPGEAPQSMKKGSTAEKDPSQQKRQGTTAAEQKPEQGAPGKEHKGQAARAKEGGPGSATREKGAEAERSKGTQSRENAAEGSQKSGVQQEDQGRAPGRAADASHPDISQDKQNRIRQAIRKEHVENVTNADFQVNVGTVVPPRYHFYPLPADIAGIVPEYRGYDYMVVNDDIVIVEPETHRIVYTMSESRSASLDRPGCR